MPVTFCVFSLHFCVVGILMKPRFTLLQRRLRFGLDYAGEFKAVLQRGIRIQVPRLIRWSYKMEQTQVLKVSVHFEGDWSSREEFFAQISKDGRICVPKLTCGLLKAAYEEESIIGAIVVVLLRPFDADETEDED
jgi:hypothetical protein